MSEKEYAASNLEQSNGYFREEYYPSNNKRESNSNANCKQIANQNTSENHCSHGSVTDNGGHKRKLEMPDTYSSKEPRQFNCTEQQQNISFNIALSQTSESCVYNLEPSLQFGYRNDDIPYMSCPSSEAAHLNSGATNYVMENSSLKDSDDTLAVAGRSRFICIVCDKSFQYKSKLDSHKVTHTEERPFSCKICKNKYSRKCALKRHMLKHLKVRKHECDQCHKKFARKDVRDEHYRIHTGERPYMCKNCEKDFTCFSSLYQHRQKCEA